MVKFNTLFEIDDSCVVSEDIYKAVGKKSKIPWVDKYRPNKLEDIAYQNEVTTMLKKTLETGDLPHLLFYGPPGTGKTSTILAVAKQLYGPNLFHERVVELNASDERGIGVVRNKIKNNARNAIGNKDPNYLCPPYKIIILDEADAMTDEAQSALRKTIEDYSSITRFCFICNYIDQIIDPITSRCVKFRFKPLSDETMATKLNTIVTKEKLQVTKECVPAIINVCKGDLRRAITLLQNIKYLFEVSGNEITSGEVYEAANCIPKHVVDLVWNKCVQKKGIDGLLGVTRFIRSCGYPIFNVLEKINERAIVDENITDLQKAAICVEMSDTERRLLDGSDEFLQLLNIFSTIRRTCV